LLSPGVWSQAFKYADAFAGIDRTLKHGSRLFGWKVMERCEHRSKPLQFVQHFRRANRLRMEANLISGRSSRLECLAVWVFVREQNG